MVISESELIVYSDTIHNSSVRLSGYEFEILNELRDLSSRTDSNCLKHTRFLFEFDDIPLKDQAEKLRDVLKDYVVRAVFSGSKSIHLIVQFSDECEEICKRWYRKIWQYLERTYFKGADSKCKNPSRLTRAPGALRADTGRVQKILFSNPDNYIDKAVPELLGQIKMQIRSWMAEEYIHNLRDNDERRFQNKSHDGMCREYKTVKRYLETPFLKVRGNGNSATWFYAAICTCIQYRDNKTLEEVKDKARREKWTEHEIEHTLSNARSAVNK
jgi:hypothetical protein